MKKYFVRTAFIAMMSATSAMACDLCGCYTPQLEALPQSAAASAFGQPAANIATTQAMHFYFAVAEQFTHFGTLQFEGHEVDNPTGQYLDSSITQLVVGYNVAPRFALQINVPIIYRSFERPEGFAIDRGTESGLGDASLLGKFVAFQLKRGGGRTPSFEADPKNPRMIETEPDFTLSAVVIGGVKFPTGSARRIKEEFNEIEIPGAPESGIHGHDLTLGTGSYDGIFGGQISMRYRSFFLQADMQYALRSEGAYGYEFADDISWSGGPGYYFVRKKELIVGVQCVVSGEHKDVDRFRGEPAEDTGITSVFLGGRGVVSWRRVSAELGAELPVSIDNTALQAVPDYRIRGGIALSF